MRVVSLVPAATELLCFCGGESTLVGRSHECDWPPSIQDRPSLTSARIEASTPEASTPEGIDAQVSQALAKGESLYHLDTDELTRLAPDVILTQSLCDVCSINLGAVEAAAAAMTHTPEIVRLNPTCIEDVFDDLLRVGAACQREAASRDALARLRERWWSTQDYVNPYLDGPQVVVLEWTDPLYVAGHWTPDIVTAAGGRHDLNPAASPSRRIAVEDLLEVLPERLVISPCGRSLQQAKQDVAMLVNTKWWSLLPAVQDNEVMLVDGQAMFSRPGPRLADALCWMTGWLQERPDLIPNRFPAVRFDPAG